MAVVAAGRGTSAWPAGQPAMYSFDNDRIHMNPETLASLQINYKNRFPLPPNSPDMHRVVEHCIGRLKTAFRKWMYAHPRSRTMREYRAALTHIFFKQASVASANVINKDVKKLPALFKEIRAAKGNWPSKRSL